MASYVRQILLAVVIFILLVIVFLIIEAISSAPIIPLLLDLLAITLFVVALCSFLLIEPGVHNRQHDETGSSNSSDTSYQNREQAVIPVNQAWRTRRSSIAAGGQEAIQLRQPTSQRPK